METTPEILRWDASDERIYNQHDQSVAIVENEVRARVFCAAPEMLAVLKMMDNAMCVGSESREDRMNGRKALIACRVAIAKAEGTKPL